ncbi:MAG: methyltransferase domain-containing protein [Zoogloeaceae bacterium]|nr:methyltransferase domain-containing protein [Rhodocyclaceae bacterium]MCP5239016.1 methyltransferase domain-containing protein [Zoogloeaceae bacterium]MCP5254096.1 methyltransferase domain-containing protein [Zoogloeaceae bacterium]MCP5295271.1 methyltransferase domain-containing protein [Zoogloeaceae bacterium]MCW5613668.1 methyltransferase domain-containing protein [Rhodocyclaceae bacterium]
MAERSEAKRAIRAAFEGAAPSYDEAASVQREICRHLSLMAHSHGLIDQRGLLLDVGCGTGFGLECLAALAPGAERIALDFAHAMLRRLAVAPDTYPLCADLEAIPLSDGCVDGVWSSLALQWSTPDRAFPELVRVLKPGGRAWLASLGPQTFHELRSAFEAVDQARHVIDFHAPESWAQCAISAGFEIRALERRECFAWSATLRGLLRDIRAIGAHSLGDGPRKPLNRQQWRQLEAAYEACRRGNGLLPATYDVILAVLERPKPR